VKCTWAHSEKQSPNYKIVKKEIIKYMNWFKELTTNSFMNRNVNRDKHIWNLHFLIDGVLHNKLETALISLSN